MNAIGRTLATIGVLLALASTVDAICGGFGPPPPPPAPAGEVPPGSREPGDPPPPDTGGPTTRGGNTRGPTTPGSDIGGPTTGGGGTGGPTTPPGGSPAPTGPTTGDGGIGGPTTGGTRPNAGRARSGPDVGHWSYWWYANRALLLDDDMRARENSAARTGDRSVEPRDAFWRAKVRSALALALSDEDDEIVASAVLALGKGANAADIPVVRRVALDVERGAAAREHAAMALGLLDAETTEDATLARSALESIASDKRSTERLKALAVLALGLRADEAAVPFLVAAARRGGGTWDLPAAGLTALGMTGGDAARDELERLLAPAARGDETMRRVYAAHGLAKLRDPGSAPALIAALDDDAKDVRRSAALALGRVAPAGDQDVVAVLREVLEKDRDRGVRSTAAISLGLIGGDAAIVALRAAYEKDDTSVRAFAAIGLGVIARRGGRPRVVVPLLRDLQRGARQELRGAVCVAVGLAGLSEAAPALREIVQGGGDPKLVAHAALALGLVQDREAAPEILRKELRRSNDSVLRGEIARALGMLGDVRTLVELDDMAEFGGSEHDRIVGCLGLGRVGGAESAALLIDILGSEKHSRLERHMAGNALGLLLDPSEGRRTGSVPADLDWFMFTPTVIDVLTEM